jgi:hypothetical protein
VAVVKRRGRGARGRREKRGGIQPRHTHDGEVAGPRKKRQELLAAFVLFPSLPSLPFSSPVFFLLVLVLLLLLLLVVEKRI